MLAGRDIISVFDFTRADLERLFSKAERLRPVLAGETLDLLRGKVLATLFFEPSTRTRVSFQIAMMRLGGQLVDLAGPEASSIAKGESLADTVKMFDGYGVDAIVIRHPMEGASRLAAKIARAPVINGGDGTREHPTQALLDVYTLWRTFGKVDGLTVGIMGDLRYGRTPPSLAYALSMFDDVTIYFIAPSLLQVRDEVLARIEGRVHYHLVERLEEVLRELDALYVTRVQKERFPDPAEYEKAKRLYRVTAASLKEAKPTLAVLHPLPRVGELAYDVDSTPHAKYFEQAANGVVVRAALLAEIMGVEVP